MDGNLARALLGVPEDASIAHIRHGFRRAVLVAHPDHGGSAVRFEQLLAARDLLVSDLAGATASTPAGRTAATASAFDRAWSAPRRSSFRAVDVRRRAPIATRTPAPQPDFADVLAGVLGESRVSAA